MNVTKKAKTWAHALRRYGFVTTDYMESKAAETLEISRKYHTDEAILSVLKEIKLDSVANPVSHLAARLKLTAVKDDGADDEQLLREMKEDDREYAYLEGLSKHFAALNGDEWHGLDLTYPGDPRLENIHVNCYKDHTWISLYDEAKREGTSIKRLCVKYGLNPNGLIYSVGEMYK